MFLSSGFRMAAPPVDVWHQLGCLSVVHHGQVGLAIPLRRYSLQVQFPCNRVAVIGYGPFLQASRRGSPLPSEKLFLPLMSELRQFTVFRVTLYAGKQVSSRCEPQPVRVHIQ